MNRLPAQLKKGETIHETIVHNQGHLQALANRSTISIPQVNKTAYPGTGLDASHFKVLSSEEFLIF